MIRIDEIYNHTFWPYIKQQLPGTRLLYCDPPGNTSTESLLTTSNDPTDSNFIYCHDQEPIYSDIHKNLFRAVNQCNLNLDYNTKIHKAAIIVSEFDSQEVEAVCAAYGWTPYYYFFHGWAALDWYRGYNKSFLISDPGDRNVQYSFVSPNRIIGGRRDHRLLLMYHLLQNKVSNALISFPLNCPHEHCSVIDIAKKHIESYPDIVDVIAGANFPWNMPGETDHPMHSCWLSLFEENAKSLVHVVTETTYFGRKHHLTEKTFKPICLKMPFVLVSNAGSLEYLRSYGFKTFNSIWNEDYDLETDDLARLVKISQLLKQFDSMSQRELSQVHRHCQSVVEYNHNHFYSGAFEQLLWQEFTTMLSSIKQNLNQ